MAGGAPLTGVELRLTGEGVSGGSSNRIRVTNSERALHESLKDVFGRLNLRYRFFTNSSNDKKEPEIIVGGME